MHEFASLNGQIRLIKEIYLAGVSNAAFYGRSIFTTIAVYNSHIFQWEKHWRRLRESSARLSIDLKTSKKQVEEEILNLISVNDVQDGRLRATVFDESAGGLWAFGEENKTSLLITSADSRNFRDGLRLTISPFPVNSKSPLANLKSGNYLENILALEECRRRGFDEAVRLNEQGEAASAVMANLFWINEKNIYTTPLETGALPGTTREFLTENFPIIEKKISAVDLKAADEIFITSAGLGAAKIKSFEERSFDNFPIFSKIQNFFNASTGK